jgi:hypothetical protein
VRISANLIRLARSNRPDTKTRAVDTAEGNGPFHPGNDKGLAAVRLEDHARGVVTILGLDVVDARFGGSHTWPSDEIMPRGIIFSISLVRVPLVRLGHKLPSESSRHSSRIRGSSKMDREYSNRVARRLQRVWCVQPK